MTDRLLFIGQWQFDLDEWWLVATALLLILTLPLTLWACWRRLHARSPARALVVMVVNVLAFTTLFLLLTEPRREHLASSDIILISEGADLESSPVAAGDSVYIVPGALQSGQNNDLPNEQQDHRQNSGQNDLQSSRQSMANANWLLDMGQLGLREPALSNLTVLGYGLDATQWQAIPDDVKINFTAPPLSGFSQMSWPHTLLMGQTLSVRGKFTGPQADGIVEIRLLDPAGRQINQQRIKNGDHFGLLLRPKSQGNSLYRLQAWQKDILLSDQPVTVSVDIATPMQIMVKQSAPSFETRQLKDFAAETGMQVLIYTNTSKGKSLIQRVNQANSEDTNFSPSSLADTDWIIMDGRALTDLPATQRQWLEDAVQSGLGLLVLADESLSTEFEKLSDNLLQGFWLTPNNDINDEVLPQLANVTGFTNELALPAFPLRLGAKNSQAPLNIVVTDQNGQPLVASQSFGLGNVAIGLISQSYRWVTAGQRTAWSNYWAAISTTLSRQSPNASLIPPADNAFFVTSQRAKVCAFTQREDVWVRISSNESNVSPSIDLPLTADRHGSARKCGWYWPTIAGWEQIQLFATDSPQAIDNQFRYIWNQNQWPGQKRFERLNATLERIDKQQQPGNQPVPQKRVTEPLNAFWLWLLFVTAASTLWLERKLDWDAP